MNSETLTKGFMDFALKLIRNTAQPGRNVLVSPYSVVQALGLAAEGARGETRRELLDAMHVQEASDCRNYAFVPQKDITLLTANSAWVRQDYPLRDDFVRAIAENSLCEVHQVPFDSETVQQINRWIDQKTKNMIPSVVDSIADDTALFLINAVCFQANWMKQYGQNALDDGIFTAANGTKQDVTMMTEKDGHSYITDEHAEGFIKEYESGKFAFAALLPKEGMTPEEYLANLTPERLYQTLSEPVCTDLEVITVLPRFRYQYSSFLNQALKSEGICKAFNEEEADFSGMTDDPDGLYIGEVLQKTFIAVTRTGTRASAGTKIQLVAAGCIAQPDPKRIILNRPFVYLIFDTQTKLPLFIGTVNSITY